MLHHPDHRDQLERLHDRHKRFSINIYDYYTSGDHEKLKEVQVELKKTEKELDALKKKLHP